MSSFIQSITKIALVFILSSGLVAYSYSYVPQTIQEAQRSIRNGEIKPIQIVEYYINQIETQNDKLQAWVSIDKDIARKEALRQEKLLEQGIDPGPLTGIPMGIKDNVDAKGWKTLAGCPKLLDNKNLPTEDATVVKRLRSAGAILLGKTVTTQFAHLDPAETKNPYNEERTPGGSSSGSAVAVATGMCMAALGTQTGGSIIRPSSYCGIVGLKPSFNSIPMDGILPVSSNLDHVGPITRCVSDAETLFNIMAGRCVDEIAPKKIDNSNLRYFLVQECFEESSEAVKNVTFAVIRDIFGKNNLPKVFTDCDIPLEDIRKDFSNIMSNDAYTFHRTNFECNPTSYKPKIKELILQGKSLQFHDYEKSLNKQETMKYHIKKNLENDMILMMPSTVTTAPNKSSTGDAALNIPWSYLGLPSITIPIGRSHEDDLPCGLQLVGTEETTLLVAASYCEDIVGQTQDSINFIQP
mmetsp:Transcript_28610/g.33252  ORF Transcript_28610/g.33252 Transcript_28610/m.33252 type:complete len:468 (+) Transcript_28610:76-1479(+)